MGNSFIKPVRSDFDTFQFERAFIADVDGTPSPRAVVSGSECDIESKDSLLDAGLSWCQPTDPTLAANWPIFTDALVDGQEQRLWNVTNNPGVVGAARKFRELALAGTAEAGAAL